MKLNILLIHADQLRQDSLSPYGNRRVRTPALDGLAADGCVFDRHYCAYPICTPSRYSLLTGLYPHQHLGWNNRCTLPNGITTFPKLLRGRGWKTAAVGKMHFTPTYLDAGFSRMTLAEQDGEGRFYDDYHRFLMERDLLDGLDLTDQRREYRRHAPRSYWDSFGCGTSDLPEEAHSTGWITDRALEELGRWDSAGGNLLMVGYIKPHHPFDPPARYAEMYPPDSVGPLRGYTETVPERDYSFDPGYFDHTALTPDRLRRMTALYYAGITHIDDGVKRMLDSLQARGLYDSTLIIFTSDHGDYLGYHHMALKGNRMYEPLMLLPLIIRFPDGAHRGERVSALSSNVDISAAVLEACGVEPEPGMARAGLFTGRDFVLGEQRRGKTGECHYMICDGRMKLLLDQSPRDGLLFDLEKDPCEQNDLFADPMYAAPRRRLTEALLTELAFRAQSRVHLDAGAPQIEISFREKEEQAAALKDYFRRKTGVTY